MLGAVAAAALAATAARGTTAGAAAAVARRANPTMLTWLRSLTAQPSKNAAKGSEWAVRCAYVAFSWCVCRLCVSAPRMQVAGAPY
jgi:hypothetical protein